MKYQRSNRRVPFEHRWKAAVTRSSLGILSKSAAIRTCKSHQPRAASRQHHGLRNQGSRHNFANASTAAVNSGGGSRQHCMAAMVRMNCARWAAGTACAGKDGSINAAWIGATASEVVCINAHITSETKCIVSTRTLESHRNHHYSFIL